MNETAITEYLTKNLANVEVVLADGNTFFFVGSDHSVPFTTLVTSDLYDTVSDLNREGVFRVNIGIGKQRYQELFPDINPADGNATKDLCDYTVLNQLLPHPGYASYGWVCILNPSGEMFEELKPLLTEAHQLAMKHEKLA